MGTALIYLLVVVAVAAAVFGIASAVFGRGEELAPLPPGAMGPASGFDVRPCLNVCIPIGTVFDNPSPPLPPQEFGSAPAPAPTGAPKRPRTKVSGWQGFAIFRRPCQIS